MILVDVNLLVYARDSSSRWHDQARDWIDGQLSGQTPVALPWASLLGFLRLVTNRRIFPNPLTTALAWQQVTSWLSAEPAWIPAPTARHVEVLGALLAEPGVYANLIPDAHLAALAIEHGLTLCSVDGDFARFRQLRWVNPLAG